MHKGIGTGAALACVFAATAGAQGLVEKPAMVVGDRWVYRTIDLWKNEETSTTESRVTSVTGDQFDIRWTTLSSVTASKVGQSGVQRADASTWTIANQRIVEGAYVALPFPIEVGKTWKFEYKIKNAEADHTVWKETATAESWEDIRVPAGSFKALKVTYDIIWTRTFMSPGVGRERAVSGTALVNAWYCPDSKRIVRRDSVDRDSAGSLFNQVRDELVSFEVKK